jgi:hypothetical protein
MSTTPKRLSFGLYRHPKSNENASDALNAPIVGAIGQNCIV